MIPMREVFIVKNKNKLKYPEGIACASVLEVGKNLDDSKSAINVISGALIGGIFKFLISFAGLIKGSVEYAVILEIEFSFGVDISPALLAVGFIVRLNIAILIFIGGFIGWVIGIPILGQGNEYINNPITGAWILWSSKNKIYWCRRNGSGWCFINL